MLIDALPTAVIQKRVDVNAVADTTITVPNGYTKYKVRYFTTTGATTSLSGSSATLGLYTAAAAGGTAIVTAATASLTPLTTSAKAVDCTIASANDTFTASTLYIRVGVAHGSAAYVDVYLAVQFLP